MHFITRFTLLYGMRAAVLMQSSGRDIEKSWILPHASPDFFATLKQALRRHPHYPLKIIIDRAGLDIKADKLPPVNAMNRRSILERQSAHLFPNGLLRASRSLRQADGNLQALHTSCPDEAALRGFFEQINTLPNPMEPLRLLPLEWESYASSASGMPQQGWAFVNILAEAVGLRQIVMQDGVPLFTRLHEDCTPSLPREVLIPRLAAHIRSTRDFLPRLDSVIPADLEARLYVPEFLKDISGLESARVQIYALTNSHAALVPPEWAADIAILSSAARQKHAEAPVHPLWLKERRDSVLKRQIAMWVLMLFGGAGIYSGMSILTHAGRKETPPPAQIAPVTELKKESRPALKLDAVLYNGPEDWAVWINGEKHMPGETGGAYKIVNVAPDGILVRWNSGVGPETKLSLQESEK